MADHCPLCGSRVYSTSTLRWNDALAKMPGPLKAAAMRQMTAQFKPAPEGRWLYAKRDGGALVVHPNQMAQLKSDIDNEVFGEDLED